MNILEQIQMTALLFPERAAMHTEEGSISYGELDAALHIPCRIFAERTKLPCLYTDIKARRC